ncbi:arginine deiminase-related protein [soil metagenome]
MTSQFGQAPNAVMMVKPVSFGFNEQTAGSNAFQQNDPMLKAMEIQEQALEEFNNFVQKLKDKNLEVIVFDDTPEPHKPDSIFPNNWISFHENGTVVLYPMQAANRRLERRSEFLITMQKDHDFDVRQILDFTHHEEDDKFLEGTGSIVFDYKNKIAYANSSPRTDMELLEDLTDTLGYTFIKFEAVDKKGQPIYHTNVIMCIGEKFAVICADCLPSDKEREMVLSSLKNSGHEVVEISFDQLLSFSGNMMEVKNKEGKSFLVLSQTAYNSLHDEQIQRLSKYAELLPIKINTIEKYGGGSVRCMLAGIFLPKL